MLVLHVCCADCLLRYLVALGYPLSKSCQPFIANYPHYQKLTAFHHSGYVSLYFYNPNIYPKSEYDARLQAVKKIATLLDISLTIANYQPQLYFSLPSCQTALHSTPSQSSRCFECQSLRLTNTFAFAQKSLSNFTDKKWRRFSSTMLVSPYLNHSQIKKISRALNTPDLHFYLPTWKTDPTSIQTSGFFKQYYCGCLFSLITRSQKKYSKSE